MNNWQPGCKMLAKRRKKKKKGGGKGGKKGVEDAPFFFVF